MSNEHVHPIFAHLMDNFEKAMTSVPAGFEPIMCNKHPEREAVAPIALRWCEECKRDAEARYADPHTNVSLGREYELQRLGGKDTGAATPIPIYEQVEKWKGDR